MILDISYIDNKIDFIDGFVNVIEVENKDMFKRLVCDLNHYSNYGYDDNINYYLEYNEKKMNTLVVFDYFNIDFNNKKNLNCLYSNLLSFIKEENKQKIYNGLNKIRKIIYQDITNYDIKIESNNENNIQDILKILDFKISYSNNFLDNLFLLITISNIFKENKILFFINLKQYLNNDELQELYKYSFLNNVKIILVDSQCYGSTLKYEKKLIIDSNLDEFLLK